MRASVLNPTGHRWLWHSPRPSDQALCRRTLTKEAVASWSPRGRVRGGRGARSAAQSALLDMDIAMSMYIQTENAARRQRNEAETTARTETIVHGSIGEGLIRLATKDLSHPMTGDMPGGYGRPQQDFNTAMQELQLTLVGVVGGADAAGLTAVGIAMAADDVSRRTEKQVANLEETAAPIAEPTTTVKKMGRRRSTCKSNCLQYQGRGGEKQRCRVRGRGSDGPHRKIIMKHKSDYRRDRRHRLPDQPSRS